MIDSASDSAPYAEVPQSTLKALENVQEKVHDCFTEMHIEMHNLELKYHQKIKEILDMRAAIIKGEKEPTDEELSDFVIPNLETNDLTKKLEKCKGIPGFWLIAIKKCPEISECFNWVDEDIHVLSFLYDITIKLLPYEDESDSKFKKGGFVLSFYFHSNPFFNNNVISKEYIVYSCLNESADDELDTITTSQIDWKAGKDYTKKGSVDTFMSFFKSYDAKKDVEQREDIQVDFDVANVFKNELIPNAVNYYEKTIDEDDFDDGVLLFT